MVKSLEIKKLKEKLKELMGDPKPTGRPRFRNFDTPAPKMQPRPKPMPGPKPKPKPMPRPGDPLRPKRMSGPKPQKPPMRYKLSPAEIRMIDNYRKKKAQRK